MNNITSSISQSFITQSSENSRKGAFKGKKRSVYTNTGYSSIGSGCQAGGGFILKKSI